MPALKFLHYILGAPLSMYGTVLSQMFTAGYILGYKGFPVWSSAPLVFNYVVSTLEKLVHD